MDRSILRLCWPLLVLIALVAATACSSAESTPVPTPTQMPTDIPPTPALPGLVVPEHDWTVRSEDEELNLILATPDLGLGTRRFAAVLTDGSGIVALPVVQLASYKYPGESDLVTEREGPVETALARYYPFPYGTRGVHVSELTFDDTGIWGIEASVPRPDGEISTIEVLVEVHENTMSVDVGETPPASVNRTLADVEDVSLLTTGSNRYESLYQISIADALQNGKPTVVVFASPAFCTNAVCGPQVEVLSHLSEDYPEQADYIHVDLYVNPKEIQGDLSRAIMTPILDEWGLVSHEWTFVMNADGVIVGRFENFVPIDELEPALQAVLESS